MDVTSGKAWRAPREEGVLFQMPLGNVARIRPVPLMSLVREGRVPNNLMALTMSALLGTPVNGAEGNELFAKLTSKDISQDEARELLEFINFLCIEAFVSPRIVEDPQADDEISIDDISYEDRGAVAAVCLQPGEVLKRFRHRQEADVESLLDVDEDGVPSEQFVGSEG